MLKKLREQVLQIIDENREKDNKICQNWMESCCKAKVLRVFSVELLHFFSFPTTVTYKT